MNDLSREEKAAAAKVRMAELANKFLNRTQADIAAIRDGLTRLSAGEAAAVGDIRHLAHRMVGTGATLGFERISERAYTIERLTETCAPGLLPDEACQTGLAEALNALDSECRELRANGSASVIAREHQ
jgi:HPt (histidine-containing phosphotransfer) domain-containing protein